MVMPNRKRGDNMSLDVLYSNLEAERARKGLTIQQAADALGISEKTYRYRLANAQNITVAALIDYANLYGCSVDYLLGLSNTIKNET
jgi:transcriptional regulator with XRE-family HTH domain